ncbi:MAG TPA: 2-hydroxyacyl-CoA dehydratase family protein [Bryobacteraceae bacterium]|nr:2-hydroxyacyl-CoA dehydratase family protein [Bryobacteraceae bacterium]
MPAANEKQLESTRAAGEHQKAWFTGLRHTVFEEHRPYAIVQADMPFELFAVMDVPVVSNQWWAALIAAKKLSEHYLDGLNARGYHEGLCRYCSLGLASTLDGDPERAPWGGLPKPALLAARLTCDCIQRVFSIWAESFGSPLIVLENPGARLLPPRWWELSRHRWNELFENDRLDLMVQDLGSLVRALKKITGRKFDLDRLRVLMEGVNRQEEYFDEVRELICRAPKTPVRMNEQVQNVMTAQWHRGSAWAVEHARRFRDEVRQHVEQGVAAYPGERLRLMWIGAGLWHDTPFYTAFEEDYGAVFVWSMYLAFGPDGYIRYGLDDPMRALASRIVSMNEQLHNPPWANEWMVEQAKRHRIDAALLLIPLGTRPSASGSFFIDRALEQARIPVLTIWADMVDSRLWDGEAMRARVRRFLEERVIRRPEAR